MSDTTQWSILPILLGCMWWFSSFFPNFLFPFLSFLFFSVFFLFLLFFSHFFVSFLFLFQFFSLFFVVFSPIFSIILFFLFFLFLPFFVFSYPYSFSFHILPSFIYIIFPLLPPHFLSFLSPYLILLLFFKKIFTYIPFSPWLSYLYDFHVLSSNSSHS